MSTITISSQDITNFRYSATSVYLRLYLDRGFVTSAGTPLQPSSPNSGGWYKQVTCTVASNTLTIPSFTIDSTVDGLDTTVARYSAFFFDASNGRQLGVYSGFESFKVGLTTPTTWSALRIYNYTRTNAPDNSAYTKDQSDARYALTSSTLSASIPVLTTTADATLTAESNLGALTTGLLKISVSGGIATPSTAVAGTDYQVPLVAGTDYLAPNGNGSSLTNLNASNLASGTVPDARFPATLPALSGANLTNLNATNLASGTVPLARLSGITTSQLSATAGILNAQLANSSITVSGTNITVSGSPVSLGGTLTLSLPNTAVTPGSYTNASITVDAQGRLRRQAAGQGAASRHSTLSPLPRKLLRPARAAQTSLFRLPPRPTRSTYLRLRQAPGDW